MQTQNNGDQQGAVDAPSPSDPFVSLERVEQIFPNGTQAVYAVSLDLQAGEFVTLVGPSGCGKSTLLKLLAGLLEPTGGTLRVGTRAPGALRREHEVAYVFQHPTLLSWRTIGGNVRLPLELRSEASDPSTSARVQAALEWVGLADFEQAYPAELSGGMQMRASLARALVTRAHLLLFDEPFGALDDLTRLRLNEEITRLWWRDRWTSLFVTHNVREAVFLGTRVLVMSPRPGRLLADIPVRLPFPRTPDLRTTQEFNNCVNQVATALAAGVGEG